jgi:hypothetical protein
MLIVEYTSYSAKPAQINIGETGETVYARYIEHL